MLWPVNDNHGVEADDGDCDGGEDDEDHVVHRGDAAHRHRGRGRGQGGGRERG